MLKKGSLTLPISDCLIGFDSEWTKNYKIKNGNIPFCFSIVAVHKSHLSIEALECGKLPFAYLQFYCERRDELNQLIESSDALAKAIIVSLNSSCTLCGHQVSSDFSVLSNMAKAHQMHRLLGIEGLQAIWHSRKEQAAHMIVDTRYDIKPEFVGKSHRLVDMCNDFLLDVTQPELGNSSMTNLQNLFYETGDTEIYERIAVMNLRHSLCAIILHWLNTVVPAETPLSPINLNCSLYQVLQDDFSWVASREFKKLL